MKYLLPTLALALSALTVSANDLTQAYEKAYFLETAKGQTKEALKIYGEITALETTDANREIIINSLERMLVLHKRSRDVSLQDKVDNFEMYPSDCDRIIDTFGEPKSYTGYNGVHSSTNLPPDYKMNYPDGLTVTISSDRISTLGFSEPNYEISSLRVGSSIEKVIAVFPPEKIKTEKQSGPRTEVGVLYRNFEPENGTACYTTDQGVRFFFIKNKISTLYLNNPVWPRPFQRNK
jgi:hypothetical protein